MQIHELKSGFCNKLCSNKNVLKKIQTHLTVLEHKMFALQYVFQFEGRAKTIEINTSGVDYVIPGTDYVTLFHI